MRVTGEIERRDQLAVARCADQEVDVRRAHAVALLRHDHLPDRAVERDEIAERPHCADEVIALVVGIEDAAAIDLLDAVLDVVAPVGRRLPHRHLGTRAGCALRVGDAPGHGDFGAVGLLGDLGTAFEFRSALAEEGAEQAGAGRLLNLGLVMHDVDQRGEAHRVRKQNELLPGRRAGLADLGHELDALDPFGRREIDLARKGVQVPHGRFHDLLHAWVRRGRHLLDHGVGDGQRCVCAHRRSPLNRTVGPNDVGRSCLGDRPWAQIAHPTRAARCID